MLHCLSPNGLCEYVCQVSCGVYILDLHPSLLDVVTDEVILGVNVLKLPVLCVIGLRTQVRTQVAWRLLVHRRGA